MYIISLFKVNAAIAAGDLVRANEASIMAKKYAMLAMIFGIIIIALCILFFVVRVAYDR